MDMPEQFSLRWNNFHSNLSSGFHELYKENHLVDVTLASADGRYLQAHKVVLSVCSPYLSQLFKINPCKHPIVILKDIAYKDLKDILQFMYQGEVNVRQYDLPRFLKTAELLQVKGLTGDDSGESSDQNEEISNPEQYSTRETSQSKNKRQLSNDSDINRVPDTKTNSSAEVLQPSKRSKPVKRLKADENSSSPRSVVDVNDVEVLDIAPTKQEPNESLLDTEDYQMKNDPDVSELLNNRTTENSVANLNSFDCGKQEGKVVKTVFQCQVCLKTFSRRDHLKTHEKNIHGEDAGPFLCSICNQVYKNTESLRKHIAKFHIPKVDVNFQKTFQMTE